MKIPMVVLFAVALSGCAAEKTPAKREMTQRQRDSVIGASKIPGAQGVRGALRVQDADQARNRRLDSVAQ
jgi:hypothetical protein